MLIALALAQALAAATANHAIVAPAADQQRLDACIAQVETDASGAYEKAMAWAHEERAREAQWCAAQALVKLERYREAAHRFELLAADQYWPLDNRIDAYSQAGNTWLLARDGASARKAFDFVVRMSDHHPDSLIDRSRAYAMLQDWPKTENDLSLALDKRPEDALALMLRATARMHRNAFELALKDAEDAQRLEPRNVDVLLVLGQAREAKRTGVAP